MEETGTRNIFSKEFISTRETKGGRNSREAMSSTVAGHEKKNLMYHNKLLNFLIVLRNKYYTKSHIKHES